MITLSQMILDIWGQSKEKRALTPKQAALQGTYPMTIQSIFLTIALSLSISTSIHAAPFQSTYTGTIGTEFGETTFPESQEGESFSVTLVFDNGEATTVSQTWNETHLTCILFVANDAGDLQYAQDLSLGGIERALSQIVTDGAGILTSMFTTLWDDPVLPGSYSYAGTSFSDVVAWYLNDANNVLYSHDYAFTFGDAAGGVQMAPENWTDPEPFTGTCDVFEAEFTTMPVPVNMPLAIWMLIGAMLVLAARQLRLRT